MAKAEPKVKANSADDILTPGALVPQWLREMQENRKSE